MYSRERYSKDRERLRMQIERARTPEERQRAEELRALRATYDALLSSVKKEMNELEIFSAFMKVAPMPIQADSERNVAPPEPDICCTIDGSPYYFELGEITDQALARNHAIMFKTDEPTGGAFSQDTPFASMLSSKAAKTYATAGAPLDLLLYYRRQHPPWEQYFVEMVNAGERDVHSVLKQNGGPFDRLWIFDFGKGRILFSA